jgi:dipeptidase
MEQPFSCDTSVALGSATFDGSTIFAKNSDRKVNECQPLRHVPRRRHAPGSTVRAQYLELPQVEETWEVIGSRPYWLWGFEIGVNEWGVAIGNEAVLSREPYETEPALIGMDLVRLGLERARTADRAVEVMGELVERHGQGGSCEAPDLPFRTYHNSFIVADPGGAWVLETAGRRWFAHRVRDWAAISNLFTIQGQIEASSPGAREHAAAQGWGGDPFSFASAYQDPAADLRLRACRLARARAILGGYREPISVDDLTAVLRDHEGYGGDLPRGTTEWSAICMHLRPDASGETAAAMVAHLRPGRPRELTATVWTAFGSPCLSVFRPVYPFAVGLPPELDRGNGRYDPASPWWVFERLQRIVSQAPDLAPLARQRLGELEGRLREEAAATEAEAERLLAAGDRDGAIGALRGLVDASSAQAVDLARSLADELEPRAAAAALPDMVEAWYPVNAEAGLPTPTPRLLGRAAS